jgi:hypothetical protein
MPTPAAPEAAGARCSEVGAGAAVTALRTPTTGCDGLGTLEAAGRRKEAMQAYRQAAASLRSSTTTPGLTHQSRPLRRGERAKACAAPVRFCGPGNI